MALLPLEGLGEEPSGMLAHAVRAVLAGCVMAQIAFCAPAVGRRVAYANAIMGGVLAGVMLQAAGGLVSEQCFLPLALTACLVLVCMVHARHAAPGLPWTLLGLVAEAVGLGVCACWLAEEEMHTLGGPDTFYLTLLFAGLLAPAAKMSVERRATPTRRNTQEPVGAAGTVRMVLQVAVEQERQRIAQDLHDSLGSQLVFMISRQDALLPEQRRTAELLEECLVALHMAVDRFHDDGSSLAHSLGGLRHRVQPAFDRMNIGLQWNVEDGAGIYELRAEHSLALLRIGQEALSNVLRHAGASVVRVRLELHGTMLEMEVSDDGTGFCGALTPTIKGKGLTGMRARATAIGAEFQIGRSQTGGARICVRYQLSVWTG